MRELPKVTFETLTAILHDLTVDRTTLSRCLLEIEQENPIIHQWIARVEDSETILRLVLLYKMLKSQAENDGIMDSLR